jgi:hypothetical protein
VGKAIMTPQFTLIGHSSRIAILIALIAASPLLLCQTPRSLDWRLDQQPSTTPCSSDELAFVNAPEQVELERSYGYLPDFSFWKCDSIKASVLNHARVIQVHRPSIIDDGVAFTLVKPLGSANVRLLPFGEGGTLLWNENFRHNRAAMNAILQWNKYGQPETIDWLALCLAYLTMLGEEPSLADTHYAPGPGEHFESYTVPGLLSELPALTRKHLLPSLICSNDLCTVRFYYRTEPVEPLKVAVFVYFLQDQTLQLLSAEVLDYPTGRSKGRASH